jgi:uncharacterized membrane protein YsdA (DUF1294 family)/cold shock CspA family protein
MRYQGRITDWNDERGSGFIAPKQGGERVYFHATVLANRSRRPVGNEIVSYTLRTDERGRPQAHDVSFAGQRSPTVAAFMIAFVFLAIVAQLVVVGRLPMAVLAWYLFASAATYLTYAADKADAGAGRWRTPESTLHFLGLVGGWPGALVARQKFRHKTRKRTFIGAFWAMVVLNCVALAWLLSPQSQQFFAPWKATELRLLEAISAELKQRL